MLLLLAPRGVHKIVCNVGPVEWHFRWRATCAHCRIISACHLSYLRFYFFPSSTIGISQSCLIRGCLLTGLSEGRFGKTEISPSAQSFLFEKRLTEASRGDCRDKYVSIAEAGQLVQHYVLKRVPSLPSFRNLINYSYAGTLSFETARCGVPEIRSPRSNGQVRNQQCPAFILRLKRRAVVSRRPLDS